MVNQGAYAHPFTHRMVMVARHMDQHGFAADQLHGVQKLRTAKRLALNPGLHGCGVVMHDVVGAQQQVAFAAGVA